MEHIVTPDYEGPDRRKQDSAFISPEESSSLDADEIGALVTERRLQFDADNLINLAAERSKENGFSVTPESLITREDDNVKALIRMIGIRIKNPSIQNRNRITISTLESRFNDTKDRMKSIRWTRIKAALEANPGGVEVVSNMEVNGHAPAVYNVDANGFNVGTCTESVPENTLNCAYDLWGSMGESSDGNAIDKAVKIGGRLMTIKEWTALVKLFPNADLYTSTWLLTPEDIRNDKKSGCRGQALIAQKRRGSTAVNPGSHNFNRGFRVTQRFDFVD